MHTSLIRTVSSTLVYKSTSEIKDTSLMRTHFFGPVAVQNREVPLYKAVDIHTYVLVLIVYVQYLQRRSQCDGFLGSSHCHLNNQPIHFLCLQKKQKTNKQTNKQTNKKINKNNAVETQSSPSTG